MRDFRSICTSGKWEYDKQGYSGGPVLDNSGRIVAMIREGWTRTSLKGGFSERVNRAFSIELLKILDSELKIHSSHGSSKTPKRLLDLR